MRGIDNKKIRFGLTWRYLDGSVSDTRAIKLHSTRLRDKGKAICRIGKDGLCVGFGSKKEIGYKSAAALFLKSAVSFKRRHALLIFGIDEHQIGIAAISDDGVLAGFDHIIDGEEIGNEIANFFTGRNEEEIAVRVGGSLSLEQFQAELHSGVDCQKWDFTSEYCDLNDKAVIIRPTFSKAKQIATMVVVFAAVGGMAYWTFGPKIQQPKQTETQIDPAKQYLDALRINLPIDFKEPATFTADRWLNVVNKVDLENSGWLVRNIDCYGQMFELTWTRYGGATYEGFVSSRNGKSQHLTFDKNLNVLKERIPSEAPKDVVENILTDVPTISEFNIHILSQLQFYSLAGVKSTIGQEQLYPSGTPELPVDYKGPRYYRGTYELVGPWSVADEAIRNLPANFSLNEVKIIIGENLASTNFKAKGYWYVQ